MPVNATPVALATALAALAATAMTTPVALGEAGLGARVRGTGSGSERTRARKRVNLHINRTIGAGAAGAIDGQIAVYGAFLPDPLSGAPQGNAFASTDSSATAGFSKSAITTVASTIAAGGSATINGGVALLDTTATTAGQPATIAAGVPTNLHIVVAGGTLLRCSASPAATEVTFTVTAGVVTLYAGASTSVPAGTEVVEYYTAAPQQVLAAGTHFFENVAIEAPQVAFLTATVAQTGGQTTAVVGHLVD